MYSIIFSTNNILTFQQSLVKDKTCKR